MSRFRRWLGILGVALLLPVTPVLGGEPAAAQELRSFIVLLDLSASMDQAVSPGGPTRLDQAKAALSSSVSALGDGQVNMGLRGFTDCDASTLFVPVGPLDTGQMVSTIDGLSTGSLTDISSALEAAADDLNGSGTIALVSDGGQNCPAPPPCDVAAGLVGRGLDITVNTVSFLIGDASAQQQLECIASATGGQNFLVEDSDDIFGVIDIIVDPTGSIPVTPFDVQLAGTNVGSRNVVTAADPVQVSSGNFTESIIDMSFGSSLFGAQLVRSFNSVALDERLSVDPPASVLGRGWRFGYESVARTLDDGEVEVTFGSGRVLRFAPDGNGGFQRPVEFYGSLHTIAGGGYRIDYFNGDRWRFDPAGRLVEMASIDADSIAISYTYDGWLESATSSTGAGLVFTNDEAGRVVGVADLDGTRSLAYAYSDDGFLASVTDAEGGVTHYETDDEGRLVAIVDPTGVVVVRNTYDDGGRVAVQQMPTGERNEFTYKQNRTELVATGRAADGTVRTERFSYRSNEAGHTVGVVDSSGQEVSLERSPENGEVTNVVDRRDNAAGNESQPHLRDVDEFGNLLSETIPGFGTASYEYTYEAVGPNGETRPLHRLVKASAPNGAVTAYTYEGFNRVPSRITGPAGFTVQNTIVDGLIARTVDADGVATSFGYDERRRIVSVANGEGETTTFAYDATGNVTTVTDPSGAASHLEYDNENRLVLATDRTGASVERSYDAAGRVVEVQDALAQAAGGEGAQAFGYDDAGQLVEATNQRGGTARFSYNEFGQTVGVDAPGGSTWSFDYGEMGRLASMTSPGGESRRTELGVDVEGLVNETVDGEGNRSTVTYDDADRIVSATDPNGVVTTYTYADETGGQLASQTAAAGTTSEQTVSYRYDNAGRLERVEGPRAGQASTYRYTPGGRVASLTDGLGNTVGYTYDTAGRVATVVLPGDRTATYEYDSTGRVTAVVSPLGERVEVRYDAEGRVVETVTAAGVTTSYTYDANGSLTEAAIGDDGPVAFDVDSLVTNAATDGNGGTTQFGYDDRLNLTRWVDQAGNATSFSVNQANEITQTVDPLGRSTDVSYDSLGRLETIEDAAGLSTTRSYDSAGRVTEVVFGDGSAQRYTYDPLGRLIAAADVDAAGKVLAESTMTFDPAGAPTSVTDADGDVVSYEWDVVGNLAKLVYPDGASISYTYDDLNRRISATHSVAGETRYEWDDDNRVTLVAFPDGSARRYEYTGGLLTGFSDGDNSWQMEHDSAGRVVTVTGSDDWSFSYDSAGQLTEAVKNGDYWRYRYDTVGNLTEVESNRPGESAIYTHDNANQLATATSDGVTTTYTYDDGGRLLAAANDNGTTTYRYDARGRLVSLTTSDGGDGDDGNNGDDDRGSVAGTVGNAGGTGQANVNVDLFTSDSGETGAPRIAWLAGTVTNNDGAYTFDAVAPGCYVVTVTAPTGRVATNTTRWVNRHLCVTADAAATADEVTLEGESPTAGAVDGRLTAPPGTGIADASIDLFSMTADGSRGSWIEQVNTDSYGRYRFSNVTAGPNVVTFIAPDNASFDNKTKWLNHATTTKAGITSTVDAALAVPVPAMTAMRGRIVDQHSGSIAEAKVDLFTASKHGQRERFIRSTTTGVDGTYRFANLEPGCYATTAVAPDGSTFTNGQAWVTHTACIEQGETSTTKSELTTANAGTGGDSGNDDPGTVTWSRSYDPAGLLATVTRSTSNESKQWDLTWDRANSIPRPLEWTTNDGDTTQLVEGVGIEHAIGPNGIERVGLNPFGDTTGTSAAITGADNLGPTGETTTTSDFGLGYRSELHTGPLLYLKARDLNPGLRAMTTRDPIPAPPGRVVTTSYAYAANDPINRTDPLGLVPTDAQIAALTHANNGTYCIPFTGTTTAGTTTTTTATVNPTATTSRPQPGNPAAGTTTTTQPAPLAPSTTLNQHHPGYGVCHYPAITITRGMLFEVFLIGGGFIPILGEALDAGQCGYYSYQSARSGLGDAKLDASLSCGALAVPFLPAGLLRAVNRTGRAALRTADDVPLNQADNLTPNPRPTPTTIPNSAPGSGAWRAVHESMSARAAAYQRQITGRSGSAYDLGGVKFDGFSGGVLQEAKGPGYSSFVRNGEFQPWFQGADALVTQAQRQVSAAGGAPIRWSVAEADAVTAINRLFADQGISGIQVVHVPAG